MFSIIDNIHNRWFSAKTIVTFNGVLDVKLILVSGDVVLKKIDLVGIVGTPVLALSMSGNKVHLSNGEKLFWGSASNILLIPLSCASSIFNNTLVNRQRNHLYRNRVCLLCERVRLLTRVYACVRACVHTLAFALSMHSGVLLLY